MFGFLNIKGIALDKNQLEKYIENFASDNTITNFSQKQTYPIPRMIENFEFITKVYNLLNEHVKLKVNIHPAGEWLLDNYYIIEENVKTIQKELTLNKYKNFVGLDNTAYRGYARIYVLACQILAYTENNINEANLEFVLKAYQKKKNLSMNEIWNIGTFLKIGLIENIRMVCEKIYSSQIQKYRAHEIFEKFVEEKNKEYQICKIDVKKQTKKIGYGKFKFPFIEYLSYKLKRIGKKGKAFLDILEEQVNMMGMQIQEVIKKEHFEIAIQKVTIGNCILTLKKLSRMNFLEIFDSINGVEEVLKNDPANIYEKMDYETKENYRNEILKLAKKTKISEIYIAQKVIELASNAKQKSLDEEKTHIGYYLISEGKGDLLNTLNIGNKYKKMNLNTKAKIYVYGISVLSVILTIIITYNMYNKINLFILTILSILTFFPISEIVVQIVQYILEKNIKPKQLPKMDYSYGIPKEDATFVVIPTIVNSKEKVQELMHKLEVFYLANKSENIYFALLGDCSTSDKETQNEDKIVIEEGKKLSKYLNNKYESENPIFHFLYRKRRWNSKESAYLGWERKRGLLTQFNEYLLNSDNADFISNTIEDTKLPKIKYIITLDADTDLSLNSAQKLIGAMAHILNKPRIKNGIVVKGHALIQPKVGININASRKSLFTQIFAGAGGTDLYTNAISDVYQDNFDEGIFTGKGIYDLNVFSKLLKNQIPENTVLSHDLLEGSYLRCGLATDILLMDGYPYKYNSFMNRLNRWIRGDWQISQWIFSKVKDKNGKSKKNPLGFLSRFKILDNLRRSLLEICSVLALALLVYTKLKYNIKIGYFVTLIFVSIIIPMILELMSKIIFRKDGQEKEKVFTPRISGYKGIFLRAYLNVSFFPNKAYVSINAIIKTLYRKYISKKHLLEWTTSEEAEKISKSDIKSYYTSMTSNTAISIICLILAFYSTALADKLIYSILFFIWIISPAIACFISKENKVKPKIYEVNKQDVEYIKEIAKETWQYFKETLVEKNNFLPPDNYQEDRKEKFANRTSSTNIGLALLCVISAYDLKLETYDYTIFILEKMLNVINSLQKWNGHLYNWYNIDDLKPLIPRYISTVDSGNLVGYLYVVKQFLESVKENEKERIETLIKITEDLINKTDFSPLYDYRAGLFSIGFNIEENKLTNSYYDLLASEARQASLVAISKGDIPVKHWKNLSRTLTKLKKYKGLISWSGTSFEYLMPNVNIPQYEGSLLDESCKFMIMSQIEYSKKVGIPWGISESAFNLKDLHSNYQYKSFGVPWLGLKRGLSDDMVVSSYGSVLWINQQPNKVIENLKVMEQNGARGKYGLYESVDFTRSRLQRGKTKEVVKTYMAHHQGLILLSINNLINNNILQKRFVKNPQIEAIDILLQERMPENVIITKEKKEKPNKIKYQDYENYTETVFNKANYNVDKYNVISNSKYSIVINQKGEGYSKYKDILVNKYKETADVCQGIFFYIKDIQTKRIWTSNYMNYLDMPDKYNIYFSPDSTKIVRVDGNIETITKISVDTERPIEIRNITLKNNGNKEETLEITGCFEPVVSTQMQDISHPILNNLFLRHELIEDNVIIERKKREKSQESIFLGVNLYTEDESVGKLECEFDKEKFFGRGNINLPIMIKDSKPFTKNVEMVAESIIALKKIVKINPGESINLSLIITVSNNKDEALKNLNEYKNQSVIKKNFELSKIKASEEIRYLGIKGSDVETYKNLMSLLIVQNKFKSLYINSYSNSEFSQEELWKFGVSGDFPILLIKVKELNDSYVLTEILKAYEYLRIKNIFMELIILNEEKYNYNSYVGEEIENCILNSQLSYLKNVKGGIFTIFADEISKHDLQLLEFTANVIIDSHLGNLKSQLKDIEEEYINSLKNIGQEEPEKIVLENETIRTNELETIDTIENLKYYNEYGAFSKDGNEYIIKVNKDNNLPTTWSHVIANENFGTLVTEGQGGYTWKENSRLNRLTAWNNNPSQDIPSEIIYLKDLETGKYWSLGARPTPDNNDYFVTYGFGYAKYEHFSLGINQKLEVFVPEKDSIKVNILTLKNTLAMPKKIKLIYYVKPVLGEDELKTNGNISIKKENNIIFMNNLYYLEKKSETAYIAISETIKSFTGNKTSFIGSGNIVNPDAMYKLKLDNESGLGNNSCAAIEVEIKLAPYEEKEISLLLGEEKNEIEIKNMVYKYTNINKCKEELKNIKNKWNKLISTIQVNTPVESMNLLLNGWLLYQTLACRLYAKTGYYQSGGAIGYRDQLQDTLSFKYIKPNIIRNQILKNAEHQFVEGDVLHWWHEFTQRGIRTRFSDDLLWLVYIIEEYIETTGDIGLLDIETSYLDGEVLPDGVNERYERYLASDKKGPIYEHCIRAIDKSLNFGENGLPKIGSGDWNDGFSEVGIKGKGESVWLGFFLYNILDRFTKILEAKLKKLEVENLETENINHSDLVSNIQNKIINYRNVMQNLKKSLNSNAWDGRWYKRAFMDDGEILGSIENEECRIDGISQSWGVISNAADNDKKYISMESLETHLVDKENGIIKLLDPPFNKSKLEPGYIKAYLPGVRENGGQYTHGAIWAIIAEAMLGFGDKVAEFFRMINPIEHSRTKETAQKYKVEPYVISADIYGAENLAGRGGWTWYTGSSSWMYKLGIEYILGLRIRSKLQEEIPENSIYLYVEPCIPKEWKEYSIQYKFKNSIYNIKIKNPNAKNTGVEKFIFNGNEIEEKEIKLQDNGGINEVEILM